MEGTAMLWDAIMAIAAVISMVAYVLTALYIRDQLKGQQQDRYLHVTNDLFTTWQDRDFMEAQLWLIHRLEETDWKSFVGKHRSDYGEIAFHRVGSFYDRVGTLVRLGFVNDREILATIGGYAIAVWNKIEPLVREARAIENSELFTDYQRLLPACHACYVPALGENVPVAPFSVVQPTTDTDVDAAARIDIATLKRRLDRSEPLTLLDVRQTSQLEQDRRTLPRALPIPPEEVEHRLADLPEARDIIAYCA
jgi:hypothetical protein